MMKFRNKKEKTETIINCERHKMKWNSKNHKKNRKNKHEHHQLLKTDNIQQDENVRTQNYARNELTTMI